MFPCIGSHCQIDRVPGRGDLLHDRRQHIANLVVAHPADQRQPAGDLVRVEPLDVLDGLLGRGGRADLEPDRVGEQLGEGDVRAVQLPGPFPDPQEVRGQGVQPRRGPGVQPQHGPLVVEQQRLVAGVELDGVQAGVVDPARAHEPQCRGRSRRPAPRTARRPGEVRTKSLFQSCTARRSAIAGAGDRPHQVHRRRRRWRRPGSFGRGSGDPRLRRGDQRVDDVAAVGRQAQRVERRGCGAWRTARRSGRPSPPARSRRR